MAPSPIMAMATVARLSASPSRVFAAAVRQRTDMYSRLNSHQMGSGRTLSLAAAFRTSDSGKPDSTSKGCPIAAGEFAESRKLPSLADLQATYGVTVTVARDAIRQLKTDGLVVSHQGKGAFLTAEASDAAKLADPEAAITELREQVARLQGEVTDLRERVAELEKK
ncbi:GntR family transcriptional regulator [Streptomyces sp. NPDC089922]|uniref:GntR family transcriptional regulator n=1 Tax=Streptomyces sp. NPDC089922 TaxID=3155189 RepID=UPI00341749F6